MVDTLLSAHNLHVGRFTSPHLTRVTERIGVDGHDVHAATFARVYDEIEPFLEMIDAALADEGRPGPTFFEALTVLALAVFADAPVDVMVLEVGMGGEWDIDERRRRTRLRLHRSGYRPPGLPRRHGGGDRPHEGGGSSTAPSIPLRNRNRSPSSPTSQPTGCSRCSRTKSPAGASTREPRARATA